jgi:hypothetical protein
MEAELFRAIEARIQTLVPEFNFIRVWNNQHEKLKEDTEEGAKSMMIWTPALLVEFTAPEEILQLGNGVQLYDPLDIRIHILQDELDAGNGEMEQNLNVFALKQRVYAALQEFEPNGACAFVRVNEEQDYDHTNLYHYIQTYRTNYVDDSMNRPVNGTPAVFTQYPNPQPSDTIIDLNLGANFTENLNQ